MWPGALRLVRLGLTVDRISRQEKLPFDYVEERHGEGN